MEAYSNYSYSNPVDWLVTEKGQKDSCARLNRLEAG